MLYNETGWLYLPIRWYLDLTIANFSLKSSDVQWLTLKIDLNLELVD